MKCTVCGAELKATRTDLPLKVRETGITASTWIWSEWTSKAMAYGKR